MSRYLNPTPLYINALKTYIPSSHMAFPASPPPSQSQEEHLPSTADDSGGAASSSTSLSPSILIISVIIAVIFVASASIHLLLRYLSSRRRSSSVSAAPPMPMLLQLRRSDSSSPSSAAVASDSGLSAKDKEALIESLPLFSLASSLAALPRSSADCAVCLYPFRPHDELRLLAACRHAFHSRCVDPWLRSIPSCPLCRTSIALPALPLPPHQSEAPLTVTSNGEPARSGSFRVEIGSVSRIRTPAEVEPAGDPPQHLRAYSLGSSLEYVVDEEVEAVVAQIQRPTGKEEKRNAEEQEEPAASVGIAAPPFAEAAEGGGRGWLREYVDRVASASSSLSSLRLSGRSSQRYDGGGAVARYSLDLEGSARREAEESGYYWFYRWLIGA